MHRRDFLKTGVQAAVVGSAVSIPIQGAAAGDGNAGAVSSPKTLAILKSYTAEDHRRRLQNAGICHREIWKHYQANPNGPHTYSGWDSVPGRAETRPRHARWLKQYLPMVEEGTWAWLEIGQSSLFSQPLPKDVVASAFANRELYLVFANYGKTPVELETSADYVPADRPSVAPTKRWNLPARSLKILRRTS